MYDLIITCYTFPDKHIVILRAECITIDDAIEIIKLYQCSPTLCISIIRRIEHVREEK